MGARVLIIDDEPDVAAYLATVLRANGHSPVIAGSAEAGFASLKEERPDVICLDIMMPKESGISMYIRLRQDRDTMHIPVIMISGVDLEEQLDSHFRLPDHTVPRPEYFMDKPVDVGEFLAAIERLTASRPPAQKDRDQ